MMKVLLSLLCFIVLVYGQSTPDLATMTALKNSLTLPKGFGWTEADPCLWKGCKCDTSKRVVRIQLGNSSISGTLPSDIQNLSSLTVFEVMNNKLTGKIPSLSGLSSLQRVNVHDNGFTSIDEDFFTVQFSATNCSLSGEIPDFLGGLTFPSLTTLKLSYNLLKMTALAQVSLQGNGFSGPIPDFSELVSLKSFNVRENQLTGTPCDPRVNTLLSIVEAFGYPVRFAQSWKGNDPCNGWVGITCSGPDITVINFKNMGLTGTISPRFADFASLQLYGKVPEFKPNVVDTSGNTDIGKDGPRPAPGSPGDSGKKASSNAGKVVLRDATDNFNEKNILGRGGFGIVYKGELHDGTKIAVKRMESSIISGKGLDEFKSEIAVLTRVRHRNLVVLHGYCLEGNERLLVYQYMPQGTLSRFIFHWQEEHLEPLKWTRRLIIALDVARGVEYLHTLAHQSFIHRDLKPSNILLGDDMHAKVADFGLVRLAPEGAQSIETKIAGTFGYLAPEYAVTGRVTTKVDVYSFGVILMELLTGRKALDANRSEEDVHLATWFRRMFINKDTFSKAIDRTMKINEETEETIGSINKVAELASHCCAREPQKRPDMSHIVNVLVSLVQQWKPAELDRGSEDINGLDYDQLFSQMVRGELGEDYTQTSLPELDNTFKSDQGR
ncbi:hypothetical protein AALP_AA1G266600 [Arabis alpina]|uniref:Protein kinase domain-containing protein n=1 Tax=Arabis alpina TaxID=50452 RepID=A0A087HQW2_ARAAL|nr:hypothetical protein AALP_AA1G266600 [Arabis alpina]